MPTRNTLSAAPVTVAVSASITVVGPVGRPSQAGQDSGLRFHQVFQGRIKGLAVTSNSARLPLVCPCAGGTPVQE